MRKLCLLLLDKLAVALLGKLTRSCTVHTSYLVAAHDSRSQHFLCSNSALCNVNEMHVALFHTATFRLIQELSFSGHVTQKKRKTRLQTQWTDRLPLSASCIPFSRAVTGNHHVWVKETLRQKLDHQYGTELCRLLKWSCFGFEHQSRSCKPLSGPSVNRCYTTGGKKVCDSCEPADMFPRAIMVQPQRSRWIFRSDCV